MSSSTFSQKIHGSIARFPMFNGRVDQGCVDGYIVALDGSVGAFVGIEESRGILAEFDALDAGIL